MRMEKRARESAGAAFALRPSNMDYVQFVKITVLTLVKNKLSITIAGQRPSLPSDLRSATTQTFQLGWAHPSEYYYCQEWLYPASLGMLQALVAGRIAGASPRV